MAKKNQWPDVYGRGIPNVLPDLLTPLNVDEAGDKLVPHNDMGEVAGAMVSGKGSPDPLDLVYILEKDGTKSK